MKKKVKKIRKTKQDSIEEKLDVILRSLLNLEFQTKDLIKRIENLEKYKPILPIPNNPPPWKNYPISPIPDNTKPQTAPPPNKWPTMPNIWYKYKHNNDQYHTTTEFDLKEKNEHLY
jgi:hypothetical protein